MKTTPKKASTPKKTTRTARAPRSRPSKGRNQLHKAGREKLSLVGRLCGLGLLDAAAADRLEKKAETLKEAPLDSGLTQTTSWDKSLETSLGAFDATKGDGNLKQRFQALMAWQNSLSELPGTREGISDALTGLKKVLPFHGASLFLRNEETQTVEPILTVGYEVQLISRIRFSEGMGFSSWVASRKKPVLYSSLHRNEAQDSDQVRSFMAAPLVVGGVCVGVLNLGHSKDETYGPATLRTLILASSMLAGLVQRHVAREQIQAREIQDPVTDLATPRYFRRRLDEEVVRCRELGHSMSLFALRLNELGEYAAQFGGDFRERCRADLASLAREWCAPTELVGHGPGDRLVVLMPSVRGEKGAARAEALRALIEKHNFPRRKRMTVSLGVGTYPADAEDSQDLLESVDKALEQALRSRNGGGGLCQAMAM